MLRSCGKQLVASLVRRDENHLLAVLGGAQVAVHRADGCGKRDQGAVLELDRGQVS